MSTLIDHDPADTWADVLAPINPIIEAREVGENITHEQYSKQPLGALRGHPDYILSGGDLASFYECPKKWLAGEDDESTKSTEWGSLIDCLMMAPREFDSRYILIPETYTNEKGKEKPWNFNADACREWRELYSDRTPIKKSTLKDAERAVGEMRYDYAFREVFLNSRKQVMLTGIYLDEATSIRVPLRALLDLVPDAAFLADLKTTRNAHPKAWRKQVYECGYHAQAARHLDLWNAAHNDNRREFRHYIQENFSPYQTAKRILSPEYISIGRETYVRALKLYAQCIATGNWPDYDRAESNADLVVDGHLVVSPEPWMSMVL